jgi:hypothetical protein
VDSVIGAFVPENAISGRTSHSGRPSVGSRKSFVLSMILFAFSMFCWTLPS